MTGNTRRCHFAGHAKKWVRNLVKRLYESTHSSERDQDQDRRQVRPYSKTVYKDKVNVGLYDDYWRNAKRRSFFETFSVCGFRNGTVFL